MKRNIENEAIATQAGVNGPLLLGKNNQYHQEKAFIGIGSAKVSATYT